MLTSISTAVTKRVLNELKKKAEKPEEYAEFWESFGAVLKEGLYGIPNEHKNSLLELVRFKSSTRDGLVS